MGLVMLCYHIYMNPEDVQLKDAIASAKGESLNMVVPGDKDALEDRGSVTLA